MQTEQPRRSLAQIYLDWLYNAPVEELIGKCEPLSVGGGQWSVFSDLDADSPLTSTN